MELDTFELGISRNGHPHANGALSPAEEDEDEEVTPTLTQPSPSP